MKRIFLRPPWSPWMWALGLAVLVGGCGLTQANGTQRPILSGHTSRSGPQEERTTALNHALSQKPNRAKSKKVASGTYRMSPVAPLKAQALFQKECASCHGTGGVGSAHAPRLKAPSAVYNTFHDPSSLASFIERNMPANHPGSLTSAQSRELADYVWHLAQAR